MSDVRFDATRARRFRPRSDHVKVAILVTPVDEEVAIRAPFGEQRMRGPFYVVADDDGSHGAAQREFERTHRRAGPCQWVKTEPVLAYEGSEAGTLRTVLDGHTEATTPVTPGSWLVQQATGEVQTMSAAAFASRYVEDGPGGP